MYSKNDKYITEDKILSLPELRFEEIGDKYVFRYGLVYDKETRMVVNKIEGFKSNGKLFYSCLPPPITETYSGPEYDFTPVTWTELSLEEFPKEEWRVHSLIPMQGMVIISAPSGEKKTWFALELTKSISTGSHFLTHEGFKTHRSKVLYIDAEMGPKILQKRCRLLGFDSIPENYAPLIITGVEVNLKTEEAFEYLESLIEENDIDVVVVDTLRAVAGGLEEDNAAAVREFYQRFNRLKNNGKVVIILDHNRKPDKGSHGVPRKEQVLGSQDKIANAEVVLMIKGDVNPSYFTVHQVKNRTGIEIKPFNVGIRDIPSNTGGMDVVSVEMNYEGELDEQTSKMDEAKLVIPQIVGNEFMTTKDIVMALAKNHDIAERYCREALNQMVDSGILEQSKKSRSHTFRIVTTNLFDQPKEDDKLGKN